MSLLKILTPPITDYEDFSQKYSKPWRIAQLLEALIVYALVMIFLWVFWWQESPYHDYTIASGGLVITLVYILFISPLIYRDRPIDWGEGSIVDYFQHMMGKKRNRKTDQPIIKGHRIVAIGFFALIQVALVVALIVFYDDLAPFAQDWLNGLIHNLRIQEGFGVEFNAIIFAVIIAVILIEAIIFFLFRYDNFRKSMKEFMKMVVFFLPVYLIIWAIYYYGASPTTWNYEGEPFVLGDFIVGWLGYVVWGTIQQMLFLGYFNTRLRKALLGYEWKLSKWAPLISALINASFFGIIHIPGYLAIFTFLGGLFWSWIFQKKGNQNLLVAGIVHGLFGTLLGTYMRFIPFSVGPEKITF